MENTSVAVSPTSLTFNPSNWNQRQTVSVEALQDMDFADEVVTLRHELPSTYFAGTAPTIEVHVDDDEEPTVLNGPPNADTVWWGTMRIGADDGIQTYGYQPANRLGYVSHPEFEYAGTTRTIEALYYSGGTVHLWMYMGSADALPNSMALHIGTDVLEFDRARHVDLPDSASTGRQHWYRWGAGQHEIDWNAEVRVGIWLEGPGAAQLPDAPTGLTATPVPGGVRLDWQAPGIGAGQIQEYEYQQSDSGSSTGRFWWSTESTATTYTVKPLSAGRRGHLPGPCRQRGWQRSGITSDARGQRTGGPPRSHRSPPGSRSSNPWQEAEGEHSRDRRSERHRQRRIPIPVEAQRRHRTGRADPRRDREVVPGTGRRSGHSDEGRGLVHRRQWIRGDRREQAPHRLKARPSWGDSTRRPRNTTESTRSPCSST